METSASSPSVSDTPPGHTRIFLVVVDDTEEMRAALAFACRRARATDGRVALLRVIEPSELQHFAFIGKIVEHETREQAEQMLQRMAAEVNRRSGHLPSLHVRQGKPVDELLALVREDPGISVLVLAAGRGKEGPGPLVTACGAGLGSRLRIPVTIVPAGMSEEEIERLA
ncbi:universal stress protein [Pararhodospirillum oryzae]|uniref:Universal stress protein n=1 Tax=Pararhodospirillum oryzae TaxID=478448 RepID=A0A512H3J2_9PROT|nr:universal stress protein [Pararhodospirillum oryzae]GEO79970.1 universal stress protein [Pararhodospirillum oryzae]